MILYTFMVTYNNVILARWISKFTLNARDLHFKPRSSKSQVRRYRSLKLGSKLKYLNVFRTLSNIQNGVFFENK